MSQIDDVFRQGRLLRVIKSDVAVMFINHAHDGTTGLSNVHLPTIGRYVI
jgi:hypothetical protein